jgi:hypothetical protein
MKFSDYTKCVEIIQLLVAMGISEIPTLPIVRFERDIVRKIEHEHKDFEDIKISQQLIDSAISINKSELSGHPGELLEYKGRKVCVYIRDQRANVNFYNKTSEYRYHLCNCGTLQSMKNIGREHRYLTTQRYDGLFEAHDLTGHPVKKGLVRMELCQFCIQIMRQKNIYFYPFSLKEYYKKYDSYIPRTIKKIEEVRETQTYSPNQGEISKEYRKANNFICQICSVDCKESPVLLHLHHEDGNPSNNDRYNLNVLCVDCHAKQPRHKHMLSNPQFKHQIVIITQLRIEQGILTAA